jgi:hypothetical protein
MFYMVAERDAMRAYILLFVNVLGKAYCCLA